MYYDAIKQFYSCLDKEIVTLEDTYELFNSVGVEEETLFFQQCKGTSCEAEFLKRVDSPDKYPSLLFEEIKKRRELFLPAGTNLHVDSLFSLFYLFDEGKSGSIAVDVKFDQEFVIYFYLNRYCDERVYITNIYLCNGESLFDKILNHEERSSHSYLQRMAVINDHDGYTNVRGGQGLYYPTVAKISFNEKFLFTPDCHSDWWKVKTVDGRIKGYMHKSRIKPIKISKDEQY